MKIEVFHHVDCSTPDKNGVYDYHYECDVYQFTDGSVSVTARSYDEDPEEASFMSITIDGEWRGLELADLSNPVLIAAKAHFHANGKIDLKWFTGKSYEPLPCITT
ncbi:hypothetical protein N5D61_19055 [Pseudomonas sp. GD03842]|uniref:hypothetical protein n=1 Tax=Pseudomonas sp. GD03842 TaxID=2975385 RepID=UPI0024497F42|nr:hypothetical protein [Pseudomonas sp. GD03842]MDH0748425.1 hypothetical protein [Pseudomonas sp. GD03842]